MRTIKIILAVAFVLAFAGIVRAENSASGYDGKNTTQQVFVSAYAYSAVSENDVVVLDVTNGTVANNGLGSYISNTTTTDSVYVFGVADEDISTGTLGRVCIRGPHKVKFRTSPGAIAAGSPVGTSDTAGKMAVRSTADGTAIGVLGVTLSASADTTDTDTQWVWVQPHVHK